MGCNTVLGITMMGRKWPLCRGSLCTGLGSFSSCPGPKPGKEGNDTSHLMVMG